MKNYQNFRKTGEYDTFSIKGQVVKLIT